MLKVVDIYTVPFMGVVRNKKYYFMFFRSYSYINNWLKENNIDWLEYTTYRFFDIMKLIIKNGSS